ncbi:MAG: response regulator transcription factor [Mycoplasmatales bacterium]
MNFKILIVEDEQSILDMLAEILASNKYQVEKAKNGVEAYNIIKENDFDLLITDVMMPLMDGYELVKLVRGKNKEIPIIMLTALTQEYDEIKAYEFGIDDYIKKPFSVSIVLKRVEAVLRRTKNMQDVVQIGDLLLNINTYEVLKDDEPIEMTVKEFEILKYLIENKNRIVTREAILEHVWGFNYDGYERNVDTHIKNIRKKTGIDCIKTIKGLGYNFVD